MSSSWTKPKKRKFAKLMTAWLDEHAAKNERFYDYVLKTDYGDLRVSVRDSAEFPANHGPWVPTRFDDPDRAKGKLRTPCNPHSGKWNFHSFEIQEADPDKFFEYVRDILASVRSATT